MDFPFLILPLLFLNKFDDAVDDGFENSGSLLLASFPMDGVIRCFFWFESKIALDLDVLGSSVFPKRFKLVSDLRIMFDSFAIVKSFNFLSHSGTCWSNIAFSSSNFSSFPNLSCGLKGPN